MSKVEAELLKVTKTKKKTSKESTQDYLVRVLTNIQKLDDGEEEEEEEEDDDGEEEEEEEEEETTSKKKSAKKDDKKPSKKDEKKPAKKDDKKSEKKADAKKDDKKPASGGGGRKSGVTTHIKKIMLKQPGIDKEDLIAELEKKGHGPVSDMTVSTVRADFRQSLQVMFDEGCLSEALMKKMEKANKKS